MQGSKVYFIAYPEDYQHLVTTNGQQKVEKGSAEWFKLLRTYLAQEGEAHSELVEIDLDNGFQEEITWDKGLEDAVFSHSGDILVLQHTGKIVVLHSNKDPEYHQELLSTTQTGNQILYTTLVKHPLDCGYVIVAWVPEEKLSYLMMLSSNYKVMHHVPMKIKPPAATPNKVIPGTIVLNAAAYQIGDVNIVVLGDKGGLTWAYGATKKKLLLLGSRSAQKYKGLPQSAEIEGVSFCLDDDDIYAARGQTVLNFKVFKGDDSGPQ